MSPESVGQLAILVLKCVWQAPAACYIRNITWFSWTSKILHLHHVKPEMIIVLHSGV